MFTATLSDYENHLSREYEGKVSKYIAFTAMTNEVTVEIMLVSVSMILKSKYPRS